MKAPASEYITLVEMLEVTVPFEAFTQAVGAQQDADDMFRV